MTSPIKLAIVDDDPFILTAFAARIAEAEGVVCSGTYLSAEDYIAEHPFTKPDVVFMDVGLPGMNGIECIRFIKRQHPDIHFIVYSVFEDGQTVLEAIKAGASGYLLKSAPLEKLVEAVDEVLRGESPLTGTIATTMLAAFRNETAHPTADQQLDVTEKTLLGLLTEGFRYKDIARRFNQTEHQLKECIRQIYVKLQLNESQAFTRHRDP